MATIVVTTLGSFGDLFPIVPVALRLRRNGHKVVFVVPQHLVSALSAEDFECRPFVMPGGAPEVDAESVAAADVRARIRSRLPEIVARTIELLVPACEDAEVMLTNPAQLAAAIVATKLGMKWVTLTPFPGNIPSGYTVPQPHWLPALPTPAGRLVNRATWRIFQYGFQHLSRDTIQEALDRAGIAADPLFFTAGALSPHLVLVLSSPRYSPREPDWPGQVKVAGHTPWDEPRGWRDPPGLDAFLAAGEPPVIVTTSSAVERDAVQFFRTAAAALAGSGRRAILLVGAAEQEMGAAPGASVAPGVVAWPYLPLSRVVPRSSLVVHHAGIGTTLTTIRYGRPCVAIPAAYDQWYNAGRIRTLGVGRVLEWKRFTTDRLAADVELVARTPGYTDRARALGGAIAAEDGAGRACEEIEALISPVSARNR